MRSGWGLVLGMGLVGVSVAALGQAPQGGGLQGGGLEGGGPGIVRRSAEQLAAQAKQMMGVAEKSPSGISSVTLERYPGHLTMLTVRTKSGGAEMHADWNDIFVVLDGEATEMTGGTIVDRKESSPGETRGTRVEGGTPTPMRKGDVIHISPNTPHQTVLEPGKTFTYYVIKVQAPKP